MVLGGGVSESQSEPAGDEAHAPKRRDGAHAPVGQPQRVRVAAAAEEHRASREQRAGQDGSPTVWDPQQSQRVDEVVAIRGVVRLLLIFVGLTQLERVGIVGACRNRESSRDSSQPHENSARGHLKCPCGNALKLNVAIDPEIEPDLDHPTSLFVWLFLHGA